MKRILLLAAVAIITGVTSGCCRPACNGPGLFGGPGIFPRSRCNRCVTGPVYDAAYDVPAIPILGVPVVGPEVIPPPS